jgi:hypothetical protein
MVFGSSVKHSRGQRVGLDHILAVSTPQPHRHIISLTSEWQDEDVVSIVKN